MIMSQNWSVIKSEIATFRDYVKKLPPAAEAKASFCYLLTKDEIDRLLALKGAGTSLDGVRIYLGGETIEGHLVPTVHVVACEKDGHQYNDYNVPESMPHVAMAAETGIVPLTDATATSGSTADLKPCPTFCSGTNILTS
jgi:hypothetical protein